MSLIKDQWKVTVKLKGVVTHESAFEDAGVAQHYFDVLSVPGVTELQVRRSGKRKFVAVAIKAQREEP